MALGTVAGRLSDQNYAQSLDFYHFWFEIGQTYQQITSDQIFDAIGRIGGEFYKCSPRAAHPLDRPLDSPFHGRCGAIVRCGGRLDQATSEFYTGATFVAHLANLGCVEGAAIRNHILQSLISHPKLYDHQVDALITLFKLAGATFGAYVDPSVVDRCFDLLKGHTYNPPQIYTLSEDQRQYENRYRQVREGLFQVRAPRLVKGDRKASDFQEVTALRGSGWEGLPPPPAFVAGKPKPTDASQKDPAATPVRSPGTSTHHPVQTGGCHIRGIC